MVNQKGGYSKIGFTSKGIYNRIDAKRRDKAFVSDSHATLMYLQSNVYSETNFYCRFSTDKKDRPTNIFWKDSHSLFEYQCFGDVLVFDNTYKTNVYVKPLVLFKGVNNHRATCVLRIALLSDETVQWYRWVLNTLIESTGHKHLIYVLTDRDEAMRQAIDEIFPNSRHKICGWHVSKNAYTHLLKEEKKSPFQYLLYKQLTENEFEEFWNKMLEQHGLEENDWKSRMYKKKHRLAEAYFKGHFFRKHAHNSAIRGYEQVHEGLCLQT
ncbi:hypothetical protein Dsin_005918 [Dipteronia sinensis]|uniref:MULE transposase domain-containing protein n=1 Tax=Dipteronia sinensis TaxID=43782 RepID=A0AAE0EF53_9ROSI|nr:hypothetical protein Dsin_005918 [Dipteronia sinensis]